MNGLIIVRHTQTLPFRKLSPHTHPALTPVCNKPLLDYLVDFAALNQCRHLDIILESGPEIPRETGLSQRYSQSDRWGFPIALSFVDQGTALEQIIRSRGGNEPVLAMDGFFFIHYDRNHPPLFPDHSAQTGLLAQCGTGCLVYAPGPDRIRTLSRAPGDLGFALASLETLGDLYALTLEVMAVQQTNYVLPGYEKREQIILGRDVWIHPNAVIRGPAVIDDHVRIMEGAAIGPHAVIGQRCLVDRNARIVHSAVLPGTYVGEDQVLFHAMASQSRIFSASGNLVEEVDDPSLFSAMALSSLSPVKHLMQHLNPFSS